MLKAGEAKPFLMLKAEGLGKRIRFYADPAVAGLTCAVTKM